MSGPKNTTYQIEMVGIETLIPYAKNSRTHSDAQVAQGQAQRLWLAK